MGKLLPNWSIVVFYLLVSNFNFYFLLKKLQLAQVQVTQLHTCNVSTKFIRSLGRGGGQVVSVLAVNFDDPSSNPTEAFSFLCKICV